MSFYRDCFILSAKMPPGIYEIVFPIAYIVINNPNCMFVIPDAFI